MSLELKGKVVKQTVKRDEGGAPGDFVITGS